MAISEILALVALACVVAAAVADVATFEIPDTLSIVPIVAAVGYGVATPGFGWLSHSAAALLFFGLGLFIFTRGWMGGGDIKLLTAVAAWTGLVGLVPMLLATAIAGGALTLLLIALRKAVAAAGAAHPPRLFASDGPIPYAVAIAAGTCWWAWRAWPIS